MWAGGGGHSSEGEQIGPIDPLILQAEVLEAEAILKAAEAEQRRAKAEKAKLDTFPF